MTKILLVEDDKSLREIYGVRLLAEGYDIVSAGDGEEALAIAIKERPALIISDVMMPKISGFDMLDVLRSTTETHDIKVIMMTALSSEEHRKRGEALNADRYLVKSQVGIEDVVRTVHDVLGDAGEAVPTAAAPTAGPAPAPAAPPPPPPPAPVAPAPAAPPPPPPAPVAPAPAAPPPPPPPPAPVAAPSINPTDTPVAEPVATDPSAQAENAISTPKRQTLSERTIQPLEKPATDPMAVSFADQMNQELGTNSANSGEPAASAPEAAAPPPPPPPAPESAPAMPTPSEPPVADEPAPELPAFQPPPQPELNAIEQDEASLASQLQSAGSPPPTDDAASKVATEVEPSTESPESSTPELPDVPDITPLTPADTTTPDSPQPAAEEPAPEASTTTPPPPPPPPQL